MSALLGNPLLLAVRRIFIGDVFDVALDTALNLDGVSTTGWDLLIAKSRGQTTSWLWRDTVRGLSTALRSDDPSTPIAFSDYATLLGAGNAVLYRYKRAPKFIDVVEFTTSSTTNTNQRVPHDLGVAPGVIITKLTAGASGWPVFHRSLDGGGLSQYLLLNDTTAAITSGAFGSAVPTDTDFGINTNVFGTSTNIVAYLFAHDDSDAGLIQCGSYTGNGSTTGPVVTLGWPPQWVFIKRATGDISGWNLLDIERAFSSIDNARLQINSTAAELTGTVFIEPAAGGFSVVSTNPNFNANGSTYIYVAIRAPS